jgi:hypothetical protein
VIGVTRGHRLALFVDCHDCVADSGLISAGRVLALFHTHVRDVAIIRWRSPMGRPYSGPDNKCCRFRVGC